MSTPLTQWNCDVCKKKIEKVESGYVIWKTNAQFKSYGFKIIHQISCDLKDHDSSAALEDFTGEKGLSRLLTHLSLGPIKKNIGQGSYCDVADLDEFVDFIRRVQTPFYEEARAHFRNQDLLDDYTDANELLPYLREELQGIIKKYSDET